MKYLQIKKRPCDLLKVMSGSNCFGITLWIFLLITQGAIVRGQTTGGPNAVALINGQATLDCVIVQLAASSWTHTTDGISSPLLIAVGCAAVTGNNAVHYITELIGGNICRLVIANAAMQQAGVYLCNDGLSTTYRGLVTVIDPVANVVVHNQSAEVVDKDQVNISCSINYNGSASPAPSLRPSPYWTPSPGQIFTSATYHPSANVVTLIGTVTVQKPTVPIFQCITVFEITGNTNGYNATAPADNFAVGNTTELDVQYGPSKLSSATRPEVITINDVPCGISVLTCYSTGNPLPSYRWYDSADNVILSTNSTLTLAEVNRKYKCEAYNTIRDVMYNESTTYIVSKDNCSTSTVDCCVYPHNETTSVTLGGCDNGTLCDCSQDSSGIILICNAKTFPNASYMWTGSDGEVTNGQVFDRVTANGTQRCTAYFDRASSNYTGNVIFTNGTNEATVGRCCETWELIISVLIPYFGWNVIVLVVFLVVYSRNTRFRENMNQGFPGDATFCLFVIASVFFGLIIIPIVVTIKYCNASEQDLLIEISILKIFAMWCFAIALLIPTAFVVVYFVHCNQMRFKIHEV